MKSHLKEILDNRGIKYSFVAKKANIANSTMSALIKGGLPTLPVAYRIAKVLDMRLEDIWIEDDYEDK
ncbi:MAG: helix-turn-helix transcriptional regulator [Bacillus paranthracis]|nr:MAG: helix-turn-helix transcriptional regulator [Bacillus paranthracis]WAI34348.1 MAG: helix-turn-helix transcriptional regulator [Bacillus paranthracis]WAI37525.1 MAG: helix-turn-helix transcriptional regulator [Bacillus paranthracis]